VCEDLWARGGCVGCGPVRLARLARDRRGLCVALVGRGVCVAVLGWGAGLCQ
jgi:hypothetical protein